MQPSRVQGKNRDGWGCVLMTPQGNQPQALERGIGIGLYILEENNGEMVCSSSSSTPAPHSSTTRRRISSCLKAEMLTELRIVAVNTYVNQCV